jgi:DNA-binding PadR family transcriptional regulator
VALTGRAYQGEQHVYSLAIGYYPYRRGLERQRLVEVVADPADGRSKLVRPTARGRESIRMALQTFTQLENVLRSRIGDRSVDQLRRALSAGWGDPPGAP